MNLVVIIPAFNEQKTISNVIKLIPKKISKINKIKIVVIDDGSTDNTYFVASKYKNVTVLKHLINRGLGGALQTGFEFAKKFNFDLLVTLDSDGQHDPREIPRLIRPILKGKADVVIGSRLKSDEMRQMPLDRLIINFIGNLVTFVMFLFWTTDSQSGFRVFSKKAVAKISIRSQKMEVSSEFFKEFKSNNLKIVELPIKPIYTRYSRLKGQTNINSLQIITRLILNIAR